MIFGSVPIDLRFGSCGSFSFAGSMTPRFVPVRVCRFVSVRGHTVYNITCMHIHFICIDVVFWIHPLAPLTKHPRLGARTRSAACAPKHTNKLVKVAGVVTKRSTVRNQVPILHNGSTLGWEVDVFAALTINGFVWHWELPAKNAFLGGRSRFMANYLIFNIIQHLADSPFFFVGVLKISHI